MCIQTDIISSKVPSISIDGQTQRGFQMTKKYDNLYDVAIDIIEKTKKRNFRRVKIILFLISLSAVIIFISTYSPVK